MIYSFFFFNVSILNSPASFISQTMTMAPKLANLRDRSLPNPPPPPVTRAISPFMLFILYLLGINDLTMASNIAKIDNNRKPITSPIDRIYVILTLYAKILRVLPLLLKIELTIFVRRSFLHGFSATGTIDRLSFRE